MTDKEIIDAAYLTGYEPSSESLSMAELTTEATDFLLNEARRGPVFCTSDEHRDYLYRRVGLNPVYALYNSEHNYLIDCPVYSSRRQAESAAAGKCRHHYAVTLHPEEVKPCTPTESGHKQCKACLRFCGWKKQS